MAKRRSVVKQLPPAPTAMSKAISFGMFVVILGIFMPGVLHALSDFLLQFFSAATSLLKTLPQ